MEDVPVKQKKSKRSVEEDQVESVSSTKKSQKIIVAGEAPVDADEAEAKRERRARRAAAAAAEAGAEGAGAEDEAPKPKKRKRDADAAPAAETPKVADPGAIENFDMSEDTRNLLRKRGFNSLFPIQVATYALIFAGKDAIGRAHTGGGKTLAFVLPIIERIKRLDNFKPAPGRQPLVLVMAPTRELAKQIGADFEMMSPFLTTLCVYGGTPMPPQEQALRRGVDVVVGTPGRLMDLLDRGRLKISNMAYVVLDEADEMLNVGFADAIEKILNFIPKEQPRQTVLFSATLQPWVQEVARRYLKPDRVMVDLVKDAPRTTPKTVRHLCLSCPRDVRPSTLADIVKVYGRNARTIVFTNTKAEATELATRSSISSDSQVLHGDIVQTQREVTLAGFREGSFSCLVATDVAARGLDITGVDLVIQTQPPKDTEAYIHRSGRTGRAGATGTVITFFTPADAYLIKRLETAAGIQFTRIGAPQPSTIFEASASAALRRLEKFDAGVLANFRTSLLPLITDLNKDDLLVAAIALLSGHSQVPTQRRSLLASKLDHTTVLITAKTKISSVSWVTTVLRNNDVNSIRDVRLVAPAETCHSALADLSNEDADRLIALGTADSGVTFEAIHELPLLVEQSRDAMAFPSGGRGGYGGGRGGFGGRGGGRGGFSGRGGGYGGRGGFRS